MEKCPNCGSTAQVRLVNEVTNSQPSALVRNFQCTGCGCTFRCTYQLVEKQVSMSLPVCNPKEQM